MKKSLFILALLFIFSSLIAQVEGTKKDTTKIKIGNRTIILVEDKNENKDNKDVQYEEKVIILDDEGEIDDIDIPEPPEAPEAPELPELPEFSDEEMEIEILGDSDRNIDKEVKIKKVKKEKYHSGKYSRWAGVNLGFNQIRDFDGYKSLKGSKDVWDNKIWSSRTWSINPVEVSLSIVKKHILLTTGIGFEFRNYSFTQEFDLVRQGEIIEPQLVDLDYSKNKLRASYVQVPLLLEFNTSTRPKKGFYLAGGLIGGYKMGSGMVQEYELNGQEIEKEIDDNKGFNLNDYQLMGTARLGFDRITFIGNIDLLPMFKDGKSVTGDDIANISFGIQLVGF